MQVKTLTNAEKDARIVMQSNLDFMKIAFSHSKTYFKTIDIMEFDNFDKFFTKLLSQKD